MSYESDEVKRLEEVHDETYRFLRRLDQQIADTKEYLKAKESGEKWPYVDKSTTHCAAAKRSSLDLSHRLAAYRQGR